MSAYSELPSFYEGRSLHLILDLCEETLRDLVNSATVGYLGEHGPTQGSEAFKCLG